MESLWNLKDLPKALRTASLSCYAMKDSHRVVWHGASDTPAGMMAPVGLGMQHIQVTCSVCFLPQKCLGRSQWMENGPWAQPQAHSVVKKSTCWSLPTTREHLPWTHGQAFCEWERSCDLSFMKFQTWHGPGVKESLEGTVESMFAWGGQKDPAHTDTSYQQELELCPGWGEKRKHSLLAVF